MKNPLRTIARKPKIHEDIKRRILSRYSRVLRKKAHDAELRSDEFLKKIYNTQRSKIPSVRIIVADFSQYSLHRKKKMWWGKSLRCGIGALFKNMARFIAGVDFKVILVINAATKDRKKVLFRYAKLQKKISIYRKNCRKKKPWL